MSFFRLTVRGVIVYMISKLSVKLDDPKVHET